MKTKLLVLMGLSLSLMLNMKVVAQDLKTEVYEKKHIPNKKPVPYVATREADVMWEKVIWRMVDLKEKMNLPLYYPTQPIVGRMSLIQLLLYGIDNEGLTAYTTEDDFNEFKTPMTKEQIDLALDAKVDTTKTTDVTTGQVVMKIGKAERKVEQVTKLMIKEKWFFDKNYSTMQVRIIGLCPLRVYAREDDPTQIVKKKTFWIYYPEARNILASHEVFNRKSDAQRISFDDIFFQRKFSSYIWGESNVYENRMINEYAIGIDGILESEKIKQSMFEFEHDLWEY
jgi:gliding motility associated protien GldN